MQTIARRGCLAFSVFLLAACGGKPNGNDNGGQSATVLRKSVNVDLAQVSSLVVLGQNNTSSSPANPALSAGYAQKHALQADPSSGPQLLALTLTGEVLNVSFVENEDPQSTGRVPQPPIQAIFPTSTWVLFSAPEFRVNVRREDGGIEMVDCRTIAARRSDGALYCAPLGTQLGTGGDPLGSTASANAAGDVVYAIGATPQSPDRTVYKIMLEQAGGPTAVVAFDPYINPNRFLSNAAGDLYVNFTPSQLQPSVTTSKIIPIDQGSPFTLQGQINVFVVSGKPGDPDQNTFYVMHGGSGGINFDGTLSIVTKTGNSFAESSYVPNLANVQSYGFIFSLSDGIYMLAGQSLARVIANGAIVTDPVPVLLTGADQLINIGGAPMRFVPGKIVLFASTGSGYKFIRHDGVVQQDILLEANVEPTSFIVSRDGAIEFFGSRTDTREKIHGTVAAGSTEAIIVSAGVVDPAQVIVFTRIN